VRHQDRAVPVTAGVGSPGALGSWLQVLLAGVALPVPGVLLSVLAVQRPDHSEPVRRGVDVVARRQHVVARGRHPVCGVLVPGGRATLEQPPQDAGLKPGPHRVPAPSDQGVEQWQHRLGGSTRQVALEGRRVPVGHRPAYCEIVPVHRHPS
jgi:hypothetical protein